jgi:toxin YoeB
MKIIFNDDNSAFEDFTAWALVDKNIYKKIISLIKDIKRNPTDGIGKPEPLKYDLSGCWSRRITDEHRLVYQIAENKEAVIIISCKYHYEK